MKFDPSMLQSLDTIKSYPTHFIYRNPIQLQQPLQFNHTHNILLQYSLSVNWMKRKKCHNSNAISLKRATSKRIAKKCDRGKSDEKIFKLIFLNGATSFVDKLQSYSKSIKAASERMRESCIMCFAWIENRQCAFFSNFRFWIENQYAFRYRNAEWIQIVMVGL